MPMAAMTNKELIKRLLDWSESDEGKINDTREVAADRIEELHNEWRFNADGWSDALVRIEAQEAMIKDLREKHAGAERVCDLLDNKRHAAETALAAERAKVAELVEALDLIDNKASMNAGEFPKYIRKVIVDARAAITEAGK